MKTSQLTAAFVARRIAGAVERDDAAELARRDALCDKADEVTALAETMLANGDELFNAMGNMSDDQLKQVCTFIARWLTGDRDAQISARYDTNAAFTFSLGAMAEERLKSLPQ